MVVRVLIAEVRLGRPGLGESDLVCEPVVRPQVRPDDVHLHRRARRELHDAGRERHRSGFDDPLSLVCIVVEIVREPADLDIVIALVLRGVQERGRVPPE